MIDCRTCARALLPGPAPAGCRECGGRAGPVRSAQPAQAERQPRSAARQDRGRWGGPDSARHALLIGQETIAALQKNLKAKGHRLTRHHPVARHRRPAAHAPLRRRARLRSGRRQAPKSACGWSGSPARAPGRSICWASRAAGRRWRRSRRSWRERVVWCCSRRLLPPRSSRPRSTSVPSAIRWPLRSRSRAKIPCNSARSIF